MGSIASPELPDVRVALHPPSWFIAKALLKVGLLLCVVTSPSWPIPPERQGTSLIRQGGAELGGWPHNLSVTAMSADAAGRIWLGTPRGVRRFDGAAISAVGEWSETDSQISDIEVTRREGIRAY